MRAKPASAVTEQLEHAATESKDRQPLPVRNPTVDEIRQRAYELYSSRSSEVGGDQDDWLQGERELNENCPAGQGQ
jgi:hypothetical protein